MLSLAAALMLSASSAQLPAPALEWLPWVALPACGGAQYSYAISKDDGRNDIQLRLRVHNVTGHVVSTRFTARVTSATGEEVTRQGRTRVNTGPLPVEGGPTAPAYYLGALFPSAVNQPRPTPLRTIELFIEAADISRPSANASPSTYLDDFRDYPGEKCTRSASFAAAPDAPFVAMTKSCFKALPRWTQTCNQAVDALVAAYEPAPEASRACILEWRQFQKCYEIYAFETAPDPRPQCEAKMPRCVP
jgi:hypothetical protein